MLGRKWTKDFERIGASREANGGGGGDTSIGVGPPEGSESTSMGTAGAIGTAGEGRVAGGGGGSGEVPGRSAGSVAV